ncbi:MipA/OmpV family protein [Brevundimonas sp. WCHBH090558]|uniref:MipA/OmpV family protein n=1 Tax=Brevundimonas huaxiensis TaxID=2725493 RepID=UPI0016285D50|nr:MipA/OmpV family protein [Brevundimonas huaxiensis]MBC1183413.1 MipA/OmpV family protein [Brevundimonas huaxiensis]
MLRPLLLSVAFAAVAGSALAQSQPYEQIRPAPQNWTVDLGAGVLYRNDSNGDTGSKTTIAPWVSANYRDLVYLNPIEGLTLDRPGFGADLAAYAYKRLPGNVVVGGRISRDVSDVSEGTEYYASIGHQRVTSVGLLNASAYVRGGDSKLADAYYGVSTAEAAANGIGAYSPGGGLQGAGASLVLLVPVGDKWGAGALLNYERRLGDVADSPLSQSDDAVRTGVFIARRFGG